MYTLQAQPLKCNNCQKTLFVMWSGKTCHKVQNIKCELLVSYESLNNPLFRTFLLGPSVILVSKVTDVQRLSKIKKNIRIMLLIFFILLLHSVQHVTGFLRSHHKWSWWCMRLSFIPHAILADSYKNFFVAGWCKDMKTK